MRRLLTAIGVLLLAFALTVLGHFYHWSTTPLPLEHATLVELPNGIGFNQVSAELSRQSVLQRPRYFAWLGRWMGADRRLQAGEYRIEPGSTPRSVLQQLMSGNVVMHELRVQEGATVAQVLAQLAADDRLNHELSGVDTSDLVAALPLTVDYAEGWFFPDTYHFQRGDSDRSILLRAHRAMQETLNETWAQRSVQGVLENPEEALILASIIEKESSDARDIPHISQVFHRRLQLGMRLQTDPTVIYALGDAFDGNLTRAHLAMPSPFNTYRVSGLPPTPIALPGRAALIAAVAPAEGEYLYFVARGDGTSQFSETLQQHNAAVRRFQLQRRSTTH